MAFGIVGALCGVVTAFLTLAVMEGWSAGPWLERLLLVCIVILVAAIGWIVVAVAIGGLLRAAAFFLEPVQPPGLIRISTIMERQWAEREAAAAGQPRQPPPQIAVELRETEPPLTPATSSSKRPTGRPPCARSARRRW